MEQFERGGRPGSQARGPWLERIGSLLQRRQVTEASGRHGGVMGRYQLLKPIAEGGMGEVWVARHDMLTRPAAVKVIRPKTPARSEAERDVWVGRFRREANVIADLRSPHTIKLYDFGVSEDGRFFYAMELLDGLTLEQLVTRFGPQGAPRVRSILSQICESLGEAHDRGFVHRDLKPSNAMVCRLASSFDFVKVLDFGLAKCAACADAADLSMDGMTGGTPGYIAPEVALGLRDIDGRADIYALGCVAYYLLTGVTVFSAPNPTAMALKHIQEPPTPPSARGELPIPESLEQLVMACLSKAPDDRPSSVREVAARLAAGEFPTWTADDASSWWQRHVPENTVVGLAE